MFPLARKAFVSMEKQNQYALIPIDCLNIPVNVHFIKTD